MHDVERLVRMEFNVKHIKKSVLLLAAAGLMTMFLVDQHTKEIARLKANFERLAHDKTPEAE